MGCSTFYRVRLVYYETPCQEDALVSTDLLSTLLTLKIAIFYNLIILKVCKYLSLFTLFYSLRVSAVLDHFGYPAPHIDQWQQRVWYDLGATQELLHQMRIRLSRAFPRSPVPRGPNHPLPLAGQLLRRFVLLMRREFVKASKGGSSAPSTANTGPSPPVATTSPKTEKKKRRKHKSVKRTVTSETVSLPEKKKKIISESPDSQAEGPFCDSDTVSAPEDSSHAI